MNLFSRFFNPQKKVSILFVPTHGYCAVQVIYEILSNSISKNYDAHLLNLGQKNLASKIKHKIVFIFAHPDRSKIGIANSVNSAPLTPANFSFAHQSFEVLGNVCFGKHVFTSPSWNNSIASWISFKSTISICSGSNELNNFWLEYYRQLFSDLADKNSLTEYYPHLRDYISDKIYNLGSGDYFDGHIVTLTCLSGFLNELTDN
jgi:hypothetical protein